MLNQFLPLLHIFKPAAAIGLGHRYTAHAIHAILVGHGPPLPTASRRLRGRDANLCRSRRHVMCQIRRRSTPDSSEYPKYALLSDWYRYIRRRGSGMPPSEALNRADEWSFSLCCVAIFLLAVCGSCGAPSETSRPCLSVRSIRRAGPRLAIG